MKNEKDCWHTYMVRCHDHTLYTGIAKDLDKRLQDHNTGKGAKYTKGRRPVTLVYAEIFPSRAAATRREYELKNLTRVAKQKLITPPAAG